MPVLSGRLTGCLVFVLGLDPPTGSRGRLVRRSRDEDYIINLCDKVLRRQARRQHRFEFLRGDTGVRLPCDAFYPTLGLVVEYRELQHTEGVLLWDSRTTVSGITRREQRARYDQRRREILPLHGITLVELNFSEFGHGSNKRLLRIPDDVSTVRSKLIEFL